MGEAVNAIMQPGAVDFEHAADFEGGANFELVCRDGSSSYGWYQNISLVMGRGSLSPDAVENYALSVEELFRRHPKGVGLVTVIRDPSPPPEQAREALLKFYKSAKTHLLAALFVLETRGFVAAGQRGLLNTVFLFSGNSNARIVKSFASGLPWFIRRVGPDFDQPKLEAGMRKFCLDEAAQGAVIKFSPPASLPAAS